MPQDEHAPPRQITGDDLIGEILRNAEAGLFKMRQTVIVPSVYHVYLHPTDYDLIRTVIPAIVTEAKAALTDRVRDWNRKAEPSRVSKYLGIAPEKTLQYKSLDPGWTVELHPDLEEKLTPGEIEVYSELASALSAEFDGAKTMHVTKRLSDGTAEDARATAATFRPPPSSTAPGERYGLLRYEDAGGQHEYAITKDQVVIGRGGKSYWVDVRLDAPPDISREHCRIRRDPASGRFYIRDASQFGTFIDGKRIPTSVGNEAGAEQPLPSRCSIGLAGVLTIEFEASKL